MKKTLALTLAAVCSVTMFSACGGSGSATPNSEMDSVGYAIGVDIATQVRMMDSTLNPDMIASGIKSTFNNSAKMDAEAANAFLMEYFSVRRPAKNREASQAYIDNVVATNPNAQKTESGLVYEILEEGSDVRATNDADVVSVMYEGKTKDGKIFDSSIQRGDTIDFALNGVIRGWGEGMKLVGTGGKIRLYIPSDLGYGEQGQPYAGIQPNEALVFDVQLVDVKPAEVPAE